MNYLFTVVMSMNSTFYDSMRPGYMVMLRLAPQAQDPDAIEVLYGDKHIGFVANSEATVLKNTLSATQLKPLIANPKVEAVAAMLIRDNLFINSASKEQRRFKANAYFVPKRTPTAVQTKVLSYRVGGTTALNQRKAMLMGAVQKAIDESRDVDIPVIVKRFDVGGVVSYKVFMEEVNDPKLSSGEITDGNQDLEDLFKMSESVRGRVVEKTERSSCRIEIVPGGKDMDKFFPVIDRAIMRGVAQAKTIESKVVAMMQRNVEDSLIEAVVEQMPAFNARSSAIPQPKQLYLDSGHVINDMLAYMVLGMPLRLVGPKGAGKNTAVETVCWLLGRPMCRVQGSSELDKMDILGSRTLKDGTTSFELSTMLETLRDDGIVVLDEANTVRPDVMTLLHSLTDGARSIDVPGYGTCRMGPHATIIYTLNEGYVGTGDMNAATVDRAPTIMMKQEHSMENLLRDACPEASSNYISLCVQVSEKIRKSVKEDGTLSDDAETVRGYIHALRATKYIPIKRALFANVAHKAQNDAERAAMEGIITSFCG